MIENPRLKRFLAHYPMSDDTWVVRGGSKELWRIKVKDDKAVQALTSVLSHVNGSHTREELIEVAGEEGVAPEVAGRVLEYLEKQDFIESGAVSGLDQEVVQRFQDQLSFFSRFTSDGGAQHQTKLRDAVVGVIGEGHLARSMVQRLSGSGFERLCVMHERTDSEPLEGASYRQLDRSEIWPAGEAEPDLLIFAQESHDPELLEAIDTFSHLRNVPWLLLRILDPHEAWIGPLFIPGETASYVSLEARFRTNVPDSDEYQAFDAHVRTGDASAPVTGALFAFLDMIAAVAAVEVVKHVTAVATPRLVDNFLTVDLFTWRTESHRVLRFPRFERKFRTRPGSFPWKEIPYGKTKSRRS